MEDITPQKPAETIQPQATSAPASQPAVPVETVVQPAPALVEPTATPAAAIETASVAPVEPGVPAQSTVDSSQSTNPVPMATDAVKKRSPIILIIAIVALVVIGLAVAAYLAFGKQKNSSTNKSVSSQVTTPVVKDPAASSDIIDQSLSKIDDTKDYDAATLSDTTLGL
jgi:hypothetical protein